MNSHESKGMLLGLLGVLIFSLTLPMTRIVVTEMNPILVGLGRALVAAVPAAALLWWRGEKRPTIAQLKSLSIVACGVILAFPVLSAWAMRSIPASHGAVLNGLQPFFVAIYAYLLGGERPSRGFWVCAVLGSALVMMFALREGGGMPQPADGLMLLAVGIGALGYAEGGKLAKQMGGWQVICWALVVAAPVLALPVGWLAWHQGTPLNLKVWLAFGYVAMFSQFLGFFAWYAGLAMGGIARVGQVQLLQIFFTIALSALLFGEKVDLTTWLFAAGVVATIAIGRNMKIGSAQLAHKAS
ncbi:DMT family transporter [Pandoraea sp.]|uniref:DMT family transporter n=1 Tax=Pandoraea sp. TaxID=1883445 RepID=UPI0011F84F01|nr:DMT family transporter [Pandoraea sp.]TAL54856.1 MAG: DMT family transporter [Pandoraea sp.]TAM18376.1 MAG: DMT family transporter [Pandoraea sp.]